MLKNGFLTFCCAFIPGAGQMYQGYMKRGLSLILTACLIGMVSSLLNPVLLLLVVVWMYSFFDTFNLRAQIIADTAPEDDYLVHFDPRDRRLARALLDSHKLVGWLLIAFGALIAYQNLIMNTLGDLVYRWGHSSPVFRALYLVMDSLPDVVVCVVLIVCGVWLVKGPHPAKSRMLPRMSPRMPISASITPTSRTTLLCSLLRQRAKTKPRTSAPTTSDLEHKKACAVSRPGSVCTGFFV